MIVLKTARELALMCEACVISAEALRAARKGVEPGVTTAEIDRIVGEFAAKHDAKPAV